MAKRRDTALNRDALAARNRALAQVQHSLSLKERVRRAVLYDVGRLPITTRKPSGERLLLIRPDHLGDVLLTTPAIDALRAALPDAELHALVGGWSADALANNDALDLVLTFAFPGFSREPKTSWRAPYQSLWRAAGQLRRVGYSAAIVFRPDHWWGAMLAKFAGIPVRVGYDQPDAAPFLTERIPLAYQHAVVQSLRLVERWTRKVNPDDAVLRFDTDAHDRAYIDAYLAGWDIAPDQPIIVVHPGAGTWVKRWDAARWAFVADTLAAQYDAAVVFTGTDSERPLAREIGALMALDTRVCYAGGDTRVSQLAALYERALVVLGPDSGPLHLAAAVGAPTVALFGPADPVEFGTWGSPARHTMLISSIACRPCRVLNWDGDDPAHHPCVRDIPAAAVLEAARRVMRA